MDSRVEYIKQNRYASWVLHLFLWPLTFTILLFVFSKGQQPVTIDFYYTIIFLLFVAVPILFNFYVLMKNLLNKEKYLWYFLCLVVLGILFGILLENYFLIVIDLLFPNYFFISYIDDKDFYLVLSILLLATTFFKLAEDWVFYNKTQNQLLTHQKKHVETQLTALRNQVNPHFLFNALNVIYAMSLEQKENVTQAIVELSDILRYVIYDTNIERVSLKDEVQLLKNYIAFQEHRVKKTPVILKLKVEDEDYKIYPMLLLPLLENAYKYGSSANKKIEIQLSDNEKQLMFKISNSKVNTNQNLNDANSGVGLSALKENLELVYQNNYVLNIVEDDVSFYVELTLNKTK